MRQGIAFVFALTFAVLLITACSGGSPEIILSEVEIDLGDIVNGEIRSLDIPIRNQGTVDLVIEAVSTSCGCTSAEVQPTTIGPGEEGMLSIQYDSGAHGPDANGPVIRQVFIASNDPNQPEAELRIIAEVLPAGS
jgi:hypothetical protein